MAVIGFNVGNTLSIDEMNLAIDYLSDKDAFEPDLQSIKDKIKSKEKTVGTGSWRGLTDATSLEREI